MTVRWRHSEKAVRRILSVKALVTRADQSRTHDGVWYDSARWPDPHPWDEVGPKDDPWHAQT
jgi:hypothetical protein